MLNKHQSLFDDNVGTLESVKAKLNVKQSATPVFLKPRPISFDNRKKVGEKLDKLESEVLRYFQ